MVPRLPNQRVTREPITPGLERAFQRRRSQVPHELTHGLLHPVFLVVRPLNQRHVTNSVTFRAGYGFLRCLPVLDYGGWSEGFRAMRHEKLENFLHLALEMQAAHGGLSLQDIEGRFGVSRRTAMRWRDAILRVFPQVDEVKTDDRTKRWRIPKGTLDRLIGCTADDLINLDTAINVLRRDNMVDQANSLATLKAKIMAVLKPDVARRVDTDLEILLEAEKLAMRPGPRPRIKTFVLEELRDAITACKVVTIKHRTRTSRKVRQRKVHPYGFLYGHRHYLVACNLRSGEEGFRLFSLPNIFKVVPTGEYFLRDETFSLESFAQKSFGVFHGEVLDVAWKFSPRAAPDAKDFVFHPQQKQEEQDDGSLIVRFRASGEHEMCWNLYAWGEDVEVLEPNSLRQMCEEHRPRWPALP